MNKLKDFFHYTKTERNGAFVLISLLFIFLVLPLLYPYLFTHETIDFSEFENEINAFEENTNFTEQKTYSSTTQKETTKIKLPDPFPFDPNTTSKETFIQLGLSQKLASTIINFRNKGGRFYKKEDLKKIYGLSDDQYLRLKPFILLEKQEKLSTQTSTAVEEEKQVITLFNFDPNTATKEELERLGLSAKAIKNMLNYRAKGGSFRKKDDLSKIYGLPKEQFLSLKPYIQLSEKSTPQHQKETATTTSSSLQTKKEKNVESTIVDINQASVEEWQELRGIGPYFAKKIITFRDALGGFHSIDQIAETYNLPDSTFQQIKPFLKISSSIKAININTASIETFKAHPYIDYKKAKLILQFRKMHGDFQQVSDIKKIKAFNDEFIQKITPYLKIE